MAQTFLDGERLLLDPMTVGKLRSVLWRLGRKLYQYARREGPNDPRTNGEYWLLDMAVAHADTGALTLLDVGANRGDWTATAQDCLTRHARIGTSHAFEPTPSTFKVLTQRFAQQPSVRTLQLAVSERSGKLNLHVVGELNGTNSLVEGLGGRVMQVDVTTIDTFLAEHSVDRVAFLKSDAEGHDLAVLRGGLLALAQGKIDIWQFEYNHRWVHDRAFLRDVFGLIEGKPYVLGKLFQGGIELYDAWHPELERYFEANFVLIRKGTFLEAVASPSHFDSSNVPSPSPRNRPSASHFVSPTPHRQNR